MSVLINKLTNANVYVDGANFIGRAEEVNLPDIKYKMTDHKGLGLIAEVEMWSGGIEKLEAQIKWTSFFRDAFLKYANPTTTRKIQLRGSLRTFTAEGVSQEVPYVCYLSGVFKNAPLGNFKQMDNAEFTTMITAYSVKLEVDGENLMEIDTLSNIFKVAGADILTKYRLNVGA